MAHSFMNQNYATAAPTPPATRASAIMDIDHWPPSVLVVLLA